jgi:predicted dehydrogenase
MIKLAIVGTGGMAHMHADRFKAIKGVKLVAACDIVPGRAAAFAEKFGIPKSFTDFDELLDKVDVDAVSVVTVDAAHAPMSLKAITKGKHVLCEKPLATSYEEAKTMADAAQKAGVINMINFSYRDSAAIQKAHQLVQEGVLGRIIHIEASYLQCWLSSTIWGDWHIDPAKLWRLSTRHGSGGALVDVGVHILDFATFASGDVATVNCYLRTFHKADGDKLGEYYLDANDSAVIMVEMKEGAIGTIHLSRWATGQVNSLRLRIYGDKGSIIVDLDQSWDNLQICCGNDVNKAVWQTITCPKTPTNYQRFIKSIQTGVNDQADFARGAEVQKMLDACFQSDKIGNKVLL